MNPGLHVKHAHVRIVYTYPYTRKFEVMQINHINLRFVSSILSQFLLYDGLFYPIVIRMHKTSTPFSDSVWSKIVKIRGKPTSRYIHVMCISLLSTYRDMEWGFENLSNRKIWEKCWGIFSTGKKRKHGTFLSEIFFYEMNSSFTIAS